MIALGSTRAGIHELRHLMGVEIQNQTKFYFHRAGLGFFGLITILIRVEFGFCREGLCIPFRNAKNIGGHDHGIFCDALRLREETCPTAIALYHLLLIRDVGTE